MIKPIAEEMYIGGELVRSLEYLFWHLESDRDRLAEMEQYGGDPKNAALWGNNQETGAHGYDEPTRTVYYSGEHGPIQPAKDSGFLNSVQGRITMSALKLGLDTGSIEWKYLISPEVPDFSIPMPDMAQLAYYALTVREDGSLKDQVDVYWTMENYAELCVYAAEQGFDLPLPDANLHHESDLIGATFTHSDMAPLRLKYYREQRAVSYCLEQDGTITEHPFPVEDN